LAGRAPPKIFISYRRDDSEGYAGRLHDALSQRFGGENVFMDVASIRLGGNFDQAIEQAVAACDVFLAVIGNRWLSATDAEGRRRLDDPKDWVRLEVQSALEHDVTVIPVMVQGARMPKEADLPDALSPLVRRQAIEMTSAGWAHVAGTLLGAIEGVVGQAPRAEDSVAGDAAQEGPAEHDDEFRYDVYVSYVDQEPDTTWVWSTLVPRLEDAGLRVAVSGDVHEPGVDRVVAVEEGIVAAKRTVLVLSPAYLGDHMASFENVLAQTIGVDEGSYRVLPVVIAGGQYAPLPPRLRMLTALDLTHPRRSARNLERLVQALQRPLPRRRPQ
jgi:hypothetical protein